jgi:hypothetical protein
MSIPVLAGDHGVRPVIRLVELNVGLFIDPVKVLVERVEK